MGELPVTQIPEFLEIEGLTSNFAELNKSMNNSEENVIEFLELIVRLEVSWVKTLLKMDSCSLQQN